MNTTHTIALASIWLALACLLICGPAQLHADTHETQAGPPPLPSHILGMWVWQAEYIQSEQAQDAMLDFCEKYGFNRLLVQVHDVKGAPTYTIRFPRELARLIREAGKRGIAVEALDGAKDMAFAKNHAKSLEKLDRLIDLNQSLPEGERFVGIHYDIEPYTSDKWNQGSEARLTVMKDLLDYYALVRQKLNDRGSKMLLACDIPMWYDNKTAPDDNCILEYDGQTKNLHEHIQDLCDYVGIMSYRTHAVGPNSVNEQIANELAYAERIGKKVCPALETIELKDSPKITFFGSSPEAFWKQARLIQETDGDRPGCAGLLIHCYRCVRELLEP